MPHYTGIDIIEIGRIEKAIARWGERFLHRVYTDAEIRLCENRPQSLAARFAGKEAVMKLLDAEKAGISWREIETIAYPSGKPLINLYGTALKIANEMGLKEITISLSHSKEYAIASAIGVA